MNRVEYQCFSDCFYSLADEPMATITDFAREVGGGLDLADQDFAGGEIVDLLDARVTLA